MSAQKLADRCSELGLPVPRAVIANLENGHRESVTVAELLVMAAALEVSPAELLFPFGESLAAEFLPGGRARVLDAARWLGGFAGLDPASMTVVWQNTGRPRPDNAVQLYQSHESAVLMLTSLLRDRMRMERRVYESSKQNAEEHLLLVRAEMRRRGLPPPPLADQLSYVEPEVEKAGDDGAH
jgi:transcriptional regulator with XRE-family HTH domain